MIGFFISRHAGLAWKGWKETAQLRASGTARALSQIRSFKAIGLQSAAYEYIEQLRATEIECFQKANLLMLCRMLSCKHCKHYAENLLLTFRSGTRFGISTSHSSIGEPSFKQFCQAFGCKRNLFHIRDYYTHHGPAA